MKHACITHSAQCLQLLALYYCPCQGGHCSRYSWFLGNHLRFCGLNDIVSIMITHHPSPLRANPNPRDCRNSAGIPEFRRIPAFLSGIRNRNLAGISRNYGPNRNSVPIWDLIGIPNSSNLQLSNDGDSFVGLYVAHSSLHPRQWRGFSASNK